MFGYTTWFTITGSADGALPIGRDAVASWFEELQLPMEALPQSIRAVDAFRAASTDLTRQYQQGEWDVTLSVIESHQNEHVVIRHVMREARHPRHRMLKERVAELKFFRAKRRASGRVHGTETWEWRIAAGVEDELTREQVNILLGDFAGRFARLRANLSHSTMRQIVRGVLAEMDAVSLKPTAGIYFVPAHEGARLQQLRELVSRVGPDCHVRAIPVPDEDQFYEMVTEAVNAEVVEEAEALLNQLEKAHGSPSRRSAVATRVQELRDRTQGRVTRWGLSLGPHAEDYLDLIEERLGA